MESKVVRAKEKADANTTARFILEDIIPRFGTPYRVKSDRGTHFLAETLKQLYTALGIEMKHSSAYRPQTQGVTERYNSTLLTMLKFYVGKSHSEWAKYVHMVTFVYNTSVQETTNFTPFYLLHGFEATQSIDLALLPKIPDQDVLKSIEELQSIWKRIHEIFKKAQDNQKRHYDVGRKDVVFSEGEQVLLQTPFVPGSGNKKFSAIFPGLSK